MRENRIRALAVTSSRRSSTIPDIPTLKELGVPGFEVASWVAMTGPKGIPKDIVNKLSTEFARIVGLPDTREKMIGQGLEPFVTNPDQFAALMKSDLAQYAKVIKTANIKLDQ